MDPFVGLLAIFGWMITARVIRSMSLSLRNRNSCTRAFHGRRSFRIIARHCCQCRVVLIIDARLRLAVRDERNRLSYFASACSRGCVLAR